MHENLRFVFRFSTGRKERGEGKGKQEKKVMSERKEGGEENRKLHEGNKENEPMNKKKGGKSFKSARGMEGGKHA